MAEAEDKKEQLELNQPEETSAAGDGEPATEETKKEGFMQRSGGSGAFFGSYGNAAGDKVESTLKPLGKPMGKGLETIARPIGGIVDPLVGGIMRFGSAHGEIAGVGAGNEDKKKETADAEAREPIGGKEQTGENPLGL